MFSIKSRKAKEDTHTGIKALRNLTEKLPAFPLQDMTAEVCNGYKEHIMDEGRSKAWDLWTVEGKVSCAKWFSTKGTKFPEHTHQQKEWVIVVEGKISIQKGSENFVLEAGSFIFIEPDTKHHSTFIEDTWYLAVTIPDNSDWPFKEKV